MIFHFIIPFILVLEASNIYVFALLNNNTDQQALLSFKASIRDDPLGSLDSWNNSIHFCQWTGVTCRRQRVTKLNLSDQQLGGTFSPHIGNLSFLRGIYLYNNNFHGSIPNDIGRLFHLKYLHLERNSFQGGFPPNLSHCVDIRDISMQHNNFEGKLPTEFASWSKLVVFKLQHNHFTGSITNSIGNTSSLRDLDLSHNNLVGGIPLEISHHTKLQMLAVGSNNLRGTVAPSLFNISSLHLFALDDNVLNGTLPSDLGSTLPELREFYGSNNTFTGPIPQSIANASNIVLFEIAKNNITGPIPNNFGSLPNLEFFSLAYNPLGGNQRPDDFIFFNSLVNCTRLNTLRLYKNGLKGELPNSIVNLSTTLEILDLYQNHIHGSIPREIGKLVNLRVLYLSDNILTGTIPESIAELTKLGTLDLSENNISGTIPASISNITQINTLNLASNTLRGSIPIQLFNMSTVEQFSLGNNRLTGVIPDEIEFFSHCIYLLLSQNLFTGPLPANIGRLKQLAILNLSYNKITRDIPATLGSCVMLEELYLEGNLFQGQIPTSFKALRNLAILDLSNNNISGSIPSFFDGFYLIKFLNLSHNKLKGEVSQKGLFTKVRAFSVDGNLELCGGIQVLHLQACPAKDPGNKKRAFSLRIILILVLAPLGVLLSCLAFIYYRRRHSKKFNDLVPAFKDDQYPKLSYQDLLLATSKFSPDNLLGEGKYGSVYRGVLESVGHTVAVKVLKVEVRGANKSFLAECEILRNIRHRNLIKIITACSSIDFMGNDFKALVFEFMTNGSLDNWLHPNLLNQANERILTLLQRLNISIDVALGMDYLHHHNHANIIHCDIKPSNILLDEDFVAHIGDFGLARFSFATTSEISQEHMSSTGVRGTVGYVPPEYGMFGEMSTEGDVYSYGILLLEIFSGKRPTEGSILVNGANDLHDYTRKALPHGVMDIADPRMLVLHQGKHGSDVNESYSRAVMEFCLESIFEVGLLCSEEMPQKRIDISVAIKKLHVARDKLLQCGH